MAGPDPKRLYLAINCQNIESIKKEKPYWNKSFVFTQPTGGGAKYTALQAAMVLRKMKVVNYLLAQDSPDLSVKSSDGKNTLIIAVQSKMPTEVLEKILLLYDLRKVNEPDQFGKTALEYSDPDSDVYTLLKSVGCKTRREKENEMLGFLVDAGKQAITQRRTPNDRAGTPDAGRQPKGYYSDQSATKTKIPSSSKKYQSSGRRGERAADLPAEPAEHKPSLPSSPVRRKSSSEDDENVFHEFSSVKELQDALLTYVNEWGTDHEDGVMCLRWISKLESAKSPRSQQKVLEKWNTQLKQDRRTEDRPNSRAQSDSGTRQSKGKTELTPSVVEEYFSGTAEQQLHQRTKPGAGRPITYVVTVAKTNPVENSEKPKGERSSARR